METSSKVEQIKDVAILLRKSRGEEVDLEKHKQELIEICLNNNWRYTIYEELGTSTEVEYRPELQKLLNDINEDLYDAVLVMDKDRLSRESTGQALINTTLIKNDCLIVTPSRVYDLSNESDILMSEVEDLMARFEYRMISKRFRRGKRRGAKMGFWVNGTPPFPYYYNPEIKGLEVDEDKNKWYQFMKEKFFEGWTFSKIAWELNKIGIPTTRNSYWHENSIRRLLLQDVHLGRIVSNKTEGSGHKNKKTKPLVHKPREEWIIKENCHKAVKTLDEHERILAILSTRRKVPKESKQIKLPLSGLVKCGKCGRSQKVFRRETRTKGYVLELRVCSKTDPLGVKCGNRGGNGRIILNQVLDEIKNKIVQIEYHLKQGENNDVSSEEHYRLKQKAARKEIEKKEKNIERSYVAYENELISLEKYKERTVEVRKEIKKLEDEIKSYDVLIEQSNNVDKTSQLEELKELANLLVNYDDISNEEMNIKINKLLKRVIYEIVWNRSGDTVKIEVNFK